MQIDVSDQDSIDAAIAAVVDHAGKLDILINNAALFDAPKTVDITRASYDKLYAVNVAGTLFTMQAAAKQMIAQGHGGKIINMASPGRAARRSPGAGLLLDQGGGDLDDPIGGAEPDQARHQRERHRARRGRRRTLGPCGCDVRQAGRQEARARRRPRSPQACRRAALPLPDDLTGMAVFLASPESDYIVSQTYNVDGGQWMS